MKKISLLSLITILSLTSCGNDKLIFTYNLQPFGYDNSIVEYTPVEILEDGSINKLNKVLYPFNTLIYIQSYIYESEKELYNDLVLDAEKEIIRLSCLFDRHNFYVDSNNDLVKNLAYLNANCGSDKYIELEKETYDLLKIGYELCELTDGKFNIFIGELTSLWDGYIKEGKDLPTQEQIDAAISSIPSVEELPQVLEFDDSNYSVKFNRFDDKNVSITFGGIAKGRMTDLLYDILDDYRCIISGGQSSIATYGDSFHDTWTLSLKNPIYSDDAHYLLLNIKGKFSFSTSGDGQNFRKDENETKYHHIINPFTGYPTTDYRTCSLLGKNGTYADALTTALMMTPLDEVSALLDKVESETGYTYNYVLMKEEGNGINAYIDERIKEYITENEHTEMNVIFF